ncbi:MAG: exosortase [Sedimentisphaerales bacterium]|nr:exosortase [Sedimentisphaerales bacterium]
MTETAGFDETRIRTVVLAGRQDFGRCPLAARLPVSLWPIAGKSALERLLCHLASEGVRDVALCCGADVSCSIGAIRGDPRLSVRLVIEELSNGTAGCLRDAVTADPGDLILVFSGSMACPPSIRDLMEKHAASGADLTVAFNPDPSGESVHGTSAEIYLCRPDVLRLIPAGGYCDIKEGLIPAILRAGGIVTPVVLPQAVGNFHDQAGYLRAISLYVRSERIADDGYALCERSNKRLAIRTTGASDDSEARIYGPVAVAEGAHLARGAVVVGPAILDGGTRIGENSVVVESVLWNDCTVGADCELRGCVAERSAVIPDGSILADQAVLAERQVVARVLNVVKIVGWSRRLLRLGRPAGGHSAEPAGRLPGWASLLRDHAAWIFGGVALLAAFLWSYWASVMDLFKEWRRSDEYSAGLLVPFLAAYVLWLRRDKLVSVPVKPVIVWGVAVFMLALAMRLFGLWFMYGSAERLSLMISVTALVIVMFGWSALRKVATVLLFLCLMLPWPHRIQAKISLPLQSWATDSAVFCLELVGYDVARDGNVIGIGTTNVAVAEACNGLRMVTAFLVISALVVLLVNRPWWEKLVILASSLPIALLCNTLRLAITAVVFTKLEGPTVEELFHDFGGYAMMPVALALVVGEFWLLGRLVTPETEMTPAVIARRKPPHVADS